MARSGSWRRARVTSETQEAGGTASDDVGEVGGVEPEVAPPVSDDTGTAYADSADSAGVGSEEATRLVRLAEPVGPDEPEAAPFRVGDLTAVLLVRAAHPRQSLLTAVGVAVAAAVSGRAGREVLLVLVTVLVGQVGLGWFNDLVDRRRDVHHDRDKPLVGGRLDAGTLWFSLAVAVFLVVPLSVGNGVHAGTAYLVSLAVAAAGTWWLPLRKGFFSWAPWVVSFALYPAFLSYGGWGGQHDGAPPTVAMTLLAALLGVGVHLLTSLWGLVPDNADGWTYLPLRLGLRLGASRLLWVAVGFVAVVLVAMALVGSSQGLTQPDLT